MNNTPSSPSVAIIGAGPGGLASAVLLAASGFDVTIYEAAPRIGGRTTQVTAGDFAFDCGPTFFMMPYVLDEIFAAAGKRLRDYVDLRRLDPMYRLILGRQTGTGPNHTVDATQDIPEMSRRLARINPTDGPAFTKFITDNRYKLRHSESILRNPMRTPLDLFRSETWLDTLKVGPVLKPWQSVHDQLSSYFTDPHVKLAVSFQSKYLGMSPFDCPSLFTILPFIEYEYGIWHPIGGCHALMQALAKLANELNVKIITDAPVAEITFGSDNHATGVRIANKGPLANATFAHDNVFINADATWALKNLIPASIRDRAGAQYQPQTLDAKKYSCSTAMLYLGVDGDVDLPHHTIYVSSKYQQNLADITTNGTISQDPSVYVCNPSRIDPTLAPKGKSSIYLLIPTPNCDGKVNWQQAMPAYRESALDQVRDQMGVNLRGRIEQEVVYTPDTWKSLNINKGATFNLAHNLGQMLHLRPQNKLPGFDNLFLVGGGTHPGSGLPTIFLSAQISTRMLCHQTGKQYAGATQRVRDIGTAREMQPVA
jgi:phytoene desaturase